MTINGGQALIKMEATVPLIKFVPLEFFYKILKPKIAVNIALH